MMFWLIASSRVGDASGSTSSASRGGPQIPVEDVAGPVKDLAAQNDRTLTHSDAANFRDAIRQHEIIDFMIKTSEATFG